MKCVLLGLHREEIQRWDGVGEVSGFSCILPDRPGASNAAALYSLATSHCGPASPISPKRPLSRCGESTDVAKETLTLLSTDWRNHKIAFLRHESLKLILTHYITRSRKLQLSNKALVLLICKHLSLPAWKLFFTTDPVQLYE